MINSYKEVQNQNTTNIFIDTIQFNNTSFYNIHFNQTM